MSHKAIHASTQSRWAQNLLLAVVIAGGGALLGYLVLFHNAGPRVATAADNQSRLTLKDIPFNGQRAYDHLKEICALGTRISGSTGMQSQQQMLKKHFEKLGGKVSFQEFRARHPQTGEGVSMANLIVEWHPERKERILICAHYDTRPYPDQDPRNPFGTFIGANDGGSGTALLMELGHAMPGLKGNLGVDFILFDGEELVFSDRDPYFLGSEHFAHAYLQTRDQVKYRYAVLLDMVGDVDLQIFQERTSLSWQDSRPLINGIWDTAKRLGVKEFVARPKFEIKDDHLALHNIAGIPSCDIIDFDYPPWHTTNDVPQNCSALSLAKVGWVLQEWLKQAVAKR